MSRPTSVQVTEVGTRDGFQAEAEFVPTATKVKLINELIAAGIPRIEFSSFVSPRAIPQLSDAVDVLSGIDRSRGTILAALVPNPRGAARAAEAGVDQMVVFISASESHNQKNVNRSIDASLDGLEEMVRIAAIDGIDMHGAIPTSFGCPFEGDVPLDNLGKVVARYRDVGINSIGLGDTTGMATPTLVTDTCRYLQDRFPDIHIVLHFHNTRGIGLCNVMAGLDEGINAYESSFGGLGGCPFAPGATGNICTEDLVFLLHEMGIDTGVDIRALCSIARDVEDVIGRQLPGQVMKAGLRQDLYAMDQGATAVG